MLEMNGEIVSVSVPELRTPKYKITADSVDELFVKLIRLLERFQWPGFRVTKTKKTKKYEITFPGGPRLELNGLIPRTVKISITIRPLEAYERWNMYGDLNRQRSVVESCKMPYGMRLRRGFAILRGNKHNL